MPDREKVIDGLEKVWDAFNHMEHELYADYVFDALALLKEQEAVAIVWKFGFPHCHVCGQMLPEGDAVKYCLHCGRSVKWE